MGNKRRTTNLQPHGMRSVEREPSPHELSLSARLSSLALPLVPVALGVTVT